MKKIMSTLVALSVLAGFVGATTHANAFDAKAFFAELEKVQH